MTDPTSDIYPYGERRLVRRLMRYWHEQRGLHPMPEENDIDPDTLGDDWAHCFLLQARDVANTQDYNFTYLGENIVRAYSDAAIDGSNEQLIGPNANRLSTHFHRVLDSRAPLIDEGEFTTLKGRRVMYRQCLMPLGTDGGVVAIFGGMNYKIW